MKNILAILLLLTPFIGFCQNEYRAANGKTYHVGDTVKVGLGSTPDGSFKYIQHTPPPFMPPQRNSSNSFNARKEFSGANGIIRKIKTSAEKNILVIKTSGDPITYDVWIDQAIAACEVTPCVTTKNTPAISVADELLKYKKLLDAGAITKAEYDAQKKKLLAQ